MRKDIHSQPEESHLIRSWKINGEVSSSFIHTISSFKNVKLANILPIRVKQFLPRWGPHSHPAHTWQGMTWQLGSLLMCRWPNFFLSHCFGHIPPLLHEPIFAPIQTTPCLKHVCQKMARIYFGIFGPHLLVGHFRLTTILSGPQIGQK